MGKSCCSSQPNNDCELEKSTKEKTVNSMSRTLRSTTNSSFLGVGDGSNAHRSSRLRMNSLFESHNSQVEGGRDNMDSTTGDERRSNSKGKVPVKIKFDDRTWQAEYLRYCKN